MQRRGQTTTTAHPQFSHTQAVVRGSPAVHGDHNNTPEMEERSGRDEYRRKSKPMGQDDVVSAGVEGEEGGEWERERERK